MEVTTNHLWKPGQSGNPMGRPKGAKNKISEKFLENLQDNWEKHGVDALEKAESFAREAVMKRMADAAKGQFP